MNSPCDEEKFISGIHTYCDRWCQRCNFTDRCRVFARELESDSADDDMETTMTKVAASLAEAKQMLVEKAEELGIDLDAISDDEFEEIRRREKAFVETDDLSRSAERYWRSAKVIIDSESQPQNDLQNEAYETVTWFLFFIPVNVKSGLHGLLDENGIEDSRGVTDPESYANGTVKSVLIATDRSIVAWTQLADTWGSERIQPVIDLLISIRTGLETRFPIARDFIRPGFDELESVM